MNLVIMFLSDTGPPVPWNLAFPDQISDECEDREIEIVHLGKKSHDAVLRLPEGTKTREAKLGFEAAWREVTGNSATFVARSAKSLAMTYLKSEEAYEALCANKRATSMGLVFIDTKDLDNMLKSECDKLLERLDESKTHEVIAKKPISRGDILVVKKGKEGEDPSFARVARLIQECYRLALERPVDMAGRGIGTIRSLHDIIEQHAPRMLAEVGLMHDVRRELEDGGLA